jgi:hypothetical protein
VQGPLSPLPDWKGDLPADPLQQAWLAKIRPSLGVAYPIDQPKERKSERVSYSKLLLTTLMGQKAGRIQQIIALNES